MTLAGLSPHALPLDVFIDAEWAALCEFIGPVEGRHEVLASVWEDLTGESVTGPGGATGEVSGAGREATEAIRGLSDDDRARMIPAYARALDEGASDEELADLDAAFAHTARYAAGQRSLVENFPDASKRRGKRSTPSASVAPEVPSGPAVGGGVSFELPDDDGDDV